MLLENNITNEEFETYRKVKKFIAVSTKILKEAKRDDKKVFYRRKRIKDSWKLVSKYMFKENFRLKFDFMQNEFKIEEPKTLDHKDLITTYPKLFQLVKDPNFVVQFIGKQIGFLLNTSDDPELTYDWAPHTDTSVWKEFEPKVELVNTIGKDLYYNASTDMLSIEPKTNFAVLKFNDSSLVGEYADKTIEDVDFDFKLIVFFVDDTNCIPLFTGTKSIFQKGKKTEVVNINDTKVWKRLTSSEFDKEVLDYSIKLKGK